MSFFAWSIPDAYVYESSDDKCLRAILEETYHTDGLNYVRMIRKNAIEIYPEGETFGQVGKADYLKEQYGLTVENIFAQAKKLVEQKAKVGVNV